MSDMLNTLDNYVNPDKQELSDNSEMTLQERIKELLAGPPVTKAIHLAAALGISRATVSAWVNGKAIEISGPNAFKVARYFGVNPEWVQNGRGEKIRSSQSTRVSWLPQPGDKSKRMEMVLAPVIAFDRAGEWQEALKMHRPSDGEIMLKPIEGVDLFVTTVPDDSMEDEFFAGNGIVVDPHMEALHKHFVLVTVASTNTIRQLLNDQGEWLLRPINERYPIRPLGDGQIVGVVRRKIIETDYC